MIGTLSKMSQSPQETDFLYVKYTPIMDDINASVDISSVTRGSLKTPLTGSTSPPWAAALDTTRDTTLAYDDTKDRYSSYQGGRKTQIQTLTDIEFYRQENWFEELCEVLFKLKRRNTTFKAEVYYGIIHFISCLYVLAVVPQQMTSAGYNGKNTVVAVALSTGIATIFCGFFANLPFVLAPPTVVSIFLSVFLQQNNLEPAVGNVAVMLSGGLLILFGFKPLGRLASRLIPLPIQVGTAIGIGLLTALAGSTEVNLVMEGKYAILKMGEITPEICISITGIIIIATAVFYHVKGSFCLAVIFCSVVWWIYDNDFPAALASVPHISKPSFSAFFSENNLLLTADLIFLYILYLNGLMTSLSNLAALTRDDSTVPRGRWIFIMCGIFTVLAGLFSSAPILVSPESSASIKEGAKTGLSAVVCGILFLLSCFFSPLLHEVPPTGTSPVLILIGIILFQNCSRIDWRNISYAAPAFIVLFYIPFTYSVIQGVIIGYVVYLSVSFFTGELFENAIDFLIDYFPRSRSYFEARFALHRGGNSSRRQSVARHTDASGNPSHSLFDHTQGSGAGGSLSSGQPSLSSQPHNDDRQSNGSSHVMAADISMSGSDTLGPQSHLDDTSRPSQTFADFGTSFNSPAPRSGGGSTGVNNNSFVGHRSTQSSNFIQEAIRQDPQLQQQLSQQDINAIHQQVNSGAVFM